MTKRETFLISGKTFWASLDKPNTMSGKYQMDLSLDKKSQELLRSKGVTLKQEDKNQGTENDRGTYVTLKKSTSLPDGTTLAPPSLIDGKKNPVPSGTLLGNGSMVNVETHVFDWTFKGKKGKGLGLGTVQIKTLVEYKTNKSTELFPEEDYVHTETTNTDEAPPFEFD